MNIYLYFKKLYILNYIYYQIKCEKMKECGGVRSLIILFRVNNHFHPECVNNLCLLLYFSSIYYNVMLTTIKKEEEDIN